MCKSFARKHIFLTFHINICVSVTVSGKVKAVLKLCRLNADRVSLSPIREPGCPRGAGGVGCQISWRWVIHGIRDGLRHQLHEHSRSHREGTSFSLKINFLWLAALEHLHQENQFRSVWSQWRWCIILFELSRCVLFFFSPPCGVKHGSGPWVLKRSTGARLSSFFLRPAGSE